MTSFHDMEPEYSAPFGVGETVLLKPGESLSFINSSGGTDLYSLKAPVTVKIVHAFWDYECGWRFWGELLEPEFLKALLAEGMSQKDHRVFFGEFNIGQK